MKYLSISILFLVLFNSNSFAKNCSGATAFIINGSSPKSDNCDFYRDLDRASKTLQNFKCHVSFGPKDKRTKKCEGGKSGSFEAGKQADYQNTFKELKKRVEEHAKKLNGKPFVLYMTDHGGSRDGVSNVSMGDGSMSIEEQRELIEIINRESPESKVITINDHCYSGGMIDSNFEEKNQNKPMKNACGFSAAHRKELAFTGETFMQSVEDFHDIKDRLDSAKREVDASVREFNKINDPWNRFWSFKETVENQLYDNSIRRRKAKRVWYDVQNRRADLESDGSLNFYRAFRSYKRENYTASTPQSTSELFLTRYFDKHKVQGAQYNRSFNEDFEKLRKSCLSPSQPEDKKSVDFSKLVQRPIFEKLIFEMKGDILNLQSKMPKHYSKMDFEKLKEIHDSHESRIQEDLDKVAKLHDQVSDLFWENWTHTKEWRELKKKLKEFDKKGDDKSSEYLKAKKRYDELDKLGDKAWEDRESIAEIKALEVEKKVLKARVNDRNKRARDIRKYYDSLIKINAIKAMMEKNDTEALATYLNVIECENTLVGDFI